MGVPAMLLAFLMVHSIGGTYMALLSEELSVKTAALAYGITMFMSGIGSFAGNWSFGALRDATHGYAAGVLLLGSFLVATAVVMSALGARSRAAPQRALQGKSATT